MARLTLRELQESAGHYGAWMEEKLEALQSRIRGEAFREAAEDLEAAARGLGKRGVDGHVADVLSRMAAELRRRAEKKGVSSGQ